ncbi:DEAD/DEAH box helicase [Butyrivibrio proteoclasticus]|uniref:DEAD/DEAH box helicase n=1 Tax=Butyrivibrio proteoclasticus TaxID=43305 RepID=UPI00047C4365|nr:DEAD/DEAH box helicase family protein [Butyrivibrio proteoclasticus]
MINELFPFQKIAVEDLRKKTAIALNSYRSYKVPQVVSLQAPTGSGKTIIMSALIEDIYFGSEYYTEQPDAIFVWLSDSPQLNEQSKQKIDQKADKIRFEQCVVISDDSFDQEVLDDGHIYFLNTQKLGKGANLSYHSDTRQYTIWETIENTAKEKSDRLYFIIDEAHRGMQGRQAGTATTIMQRFIKGSVDFNLSPVPVVIGMSATADRFNNLVGETTSTLQKTIVSPAQVRASGLLKDRIVITYPEDPSKYNDMSVLQAATDEWIDKCKHWYQYTYEQHYANVNPVLVVQVLAGSGSKVSDTDLDDVIAKIEERMRDHFEEGEVVHTFGSVGNLEINGLNVPHIEAADIADNRKVKVVLFKENLSTGWDCPRAETMMSFRKAEDATYIAQLLGRMVRTPLQCHVMVDDSLNDVRLFLPYFNKDTVQNVIDELQNSEGGEIPTVIDGEAMEEQVYTSWTVHTRKKREEKQVPGQMNLFLWAAGQTSSDVNVLREEEVPYNTPRNSGTQSTETSSEKETNNSGVNTDYKDVHPQQEPLPIINNPVQPNAGTESELNMTYEQMSFVPELDREAVIKFINEQGFLTYMVKDVRINSYLKSLLSLAGLLTQYMIYMNANDEVKNEVTDMIRDYVTDLHKNGKYDELAKQVMEFKLSIQIFDVFGESINNYSLSDWFMTSESDLDRQLRAADARLGGYGFPMVYGRRFIDFDNPNAFKIDCILFAADDECMAKLNKYAEKKFHDFNDTYRKYVVSKSEKCKKQYSDIVADGDLVSKHNFTLPETISAKMEAGGKKYTDHLFADEEGVATIKLNGWEEGVLEEERKRVDFVCWLRNPSRQTWSLRIPYEIDGVTKPTYPDFVIIRKDDQLGYVMDILEPHNPDFKDNLNKAKAFAKYAELEARIGRIELIRKGKDAAGKDRFKRLDMAKGAIRNKVLAAVNNDELDHIFDTDGVFQD